MTQVWTDGQPWTDANPWTDEYLERELASMQHLAPYDDGRLVLIPDKHRPFTDGPIRCYMRSDLVEWGPFPLLGERNPAPMDDLVWMSITPMEIESQYMPIALAEGCVGIGGLGLGYATQRILSKPNVDRVTVFEVNPRIIALFQQNFPEQADDPRLEISEQDVGTVQGKSFDVFFNDVYARMLEDLTFEHWRVLIERNEIGVYHPWGLEAMLMSFVRYDARNDVPFGLRYTYFPFLKQLLAAITEGHGAFSDDYIPPLELARKDAIALGYDVWPVD
ncbi:MAG TPA: hypothetical protein VGJ60_07375 [Chloroflexota bacterium]|jgi:hypothetical protein